MRYTNIPAAHSLVQHCRARGIKNIVISPGSRNAPLVVGFTGDSFFRCYSIVDERSAAFFALGMAQQLQEGVAVVCTSGSALLNYYPAVSEAFYSNIPLVVISADRPPYKIDIGDGQTIRQEDVFHRHILRTAYLKQDVVHAPEAIRAAGVSLPSHNADLMGLQKEIQEFNDARLNQALGRPFHTKGPVHINIPLEEPLYGSVEKAMVTPVIQGFAKPDTWTGDSLEDLAEIWSTAGRKMVIIGAGPPGQLGTPFLEALAKDPSVLVFTETTSNCHHPEFFPSIDSIIAPIEKLTERDQQFRELQPQLLLSIGGMVVSKKIKAFLRAYQPEYHWHIGQGNAYDTYYSLSHKIDASPNQFFASFMPFMQRIDSTYKGRWAEVRSCYRLKRKEYLSQIPFTDMLAFEYILKSIPHQYQVQLANSSTVRYTQLFDMHPSLKVFCNRGTSGIDGSTSTAVGASQFEANPTIFITGDLSFLYDSNGLWTDYMRPDFRIIVINNQGGGIFRILPGKEDSEVFETYFETVQHLDISKLCELFNLEHQVVSGGEELVDALAQFYQTSDRARVLEVQTPRLVNNKILLAYFDFLS